MEEIGALTKDSSSDDNQSERKVVDLTKGQDGLGLGLGLGVQEEQRRAVIKTNDRPLGLGYPPPKRPFNHGGGGAVDLRARIGGKGKGRFVPNNRILEVRKIPREFNNITKLNEHFSKFGNIVNLQVSVMIDITVLSVIGPYQQKKSSSPL